MENTTGIEGLRSLMIEMGKKISSLDNKFTSMENKMDKKISSLDNKITSVENKMDEMDKTVASATSDVKKFGEKLNKLSRDMDDVYQGRNNAMPLESLVAAMSQAASIKTGPTLSGFSTGKAKKMQILSHLNISR